MHLAHEKQDEGEGVHSALIDPLIGLIGHGDQAMSTPVCEISKKIRVGPIVDGDRSIKSHGDFVGGIEGHEGCDLAPARSLPVNMIDKVYLP